MHDYHGFVYQVCGYFLSLQTIDWIMRVENEFFPVIGGELGSSMDTVQHYQKKLDEFLPTAKV